MLEEYIDIMQPRQDSIDYAIACALDAIGRPDAELWQLEVARLRDRMEKTQQESSHDV